MNDLERMWMEWSSPEISLEVVRKTLKNPSQNSQFLSYDSNRVPPNKKQDYKALPTMLVN
jgi:hypothetical protein